MNICMAGDMQDLTLVYLAWQMRQRNINVIELEESFFGEQWTFDYSDTDIRSGMLYYEKNSIPLSEIHGVFSRFNAQPGLPDKFSFKDAAHQAVYIEERRNAVNHFLNSLPCAVINRPFTGMSNASKPFQMKKLEDAGFRVPRWIVTNNYDKAYEFVSNCREGAVCKSLSGLRSQVRKADDTLFNKLKEGTSPVILQEFIKGADVRVHTLPAQVYPTIIKSSGVDYRFESDDAEYDATEIPGDLTQMCIEFARQDNLVLAGFDFKLTSSGLWYCLEMNPVPTFLPYEMTTRQPIAEGIIDYFMAQ